MVAGNKGTGKKSQKISQFWLGKKVGYSRAIKQKYLSLSQFILSRKYFKSVLTGNK